MVQITISQYFKQKYEKKNEELNSDFVVMAGDCNLVIRPEIDFDNYLHINNRNARNEVLKLKEDLNLVNIWRIQHSDSKRYTWPS